MLSARHITKKFSGVSALDDVSLNLKSGKVTAIVGENGAGKSTLMKILSGVYTDYEGEIELNNKIIRLKDHRDAQDHGIAIIYQELNLLPHLTVTENLFLGRELIDSLGLLDKSRMKMEANKILAYIHLDISPETPVKDLKIGQQQLVEISKALLADARVIIMDEPTSAITEAEVKFLFDIILDLKAKGKAIAYISHKLDELFRIADDYIVLRDGKFIDSGQMNHITKRELISKMVGREVNFKSNVDRKPSQEIIFQVKNLRLAKFNHDISFELYSGEILGIFGLMGAGRTEMFESIFGLSNLEGSKVYVDGKAVNIHSPEDAIRSGLALVPEDRKRDGIIPNMSVLRNLSLSSLSRISSYSIIQVEKEKELFKKYYDELRIKSNHREQKIKYLSGGNQQKVIIAKWLATHPRVFLLDEPTRGIDIHAKTEIYSILRWLAEQGIGIIMISSELPEILSTCDRVLVMNQGKLTGNFSVQDSSEEILLHAAIA